MIKFQVFILLLVSLFFNSSAYAMSFGSIKGQISYCGQGGLDGMIIYIPGRQFSVITDSTGQFQFDLAPVGQYVIHIRYAIKKLQKNIAVLVKEDNLTELNIINICDYVIKEKGSTNLESTATGVTDDTNAIRKDVDKDKDGFSQGKDCNDNDPLINPGATDICDGKDNNCNGQIDENEIYLIWNGLGGCKDGVLQIDQCSSGFSDCDADPSNGCEIDINNDNEHCGSCTNSCSSLEECLQGLC